LPISAGSSTSTASSSQPTVPAVSAARARPPPASRSTRRRDGDLKVPDDLSFDVLARIGIRRTAVNRSDQEHVHHPVQREQEGLGSISNVRANPCDQER